MFATRGWVVGSLILLAASGAAAAAAEGYVLVLTDGSFVQATEKPTVDGGLAQVRLPGGLLARIPADRIDWKRSDERSRPRPLFEMTGAAAVDLPPARHEVPGTLTLIGTPSKAAPAEKAAAGPAAPPQPAPPADPRADLHARAQALGDEIEALGKQKLELEDRIRRTIQLEEIPELRRQADAIDAQIKQKRAEMSSLILQVGGPAQP